MANGIWKDSQQYLPLENFQLNSNEISLTYTKMAKIPITGKYVEQQKHLFTVAMQKSTKLWKIVWNVLIESDRVLP